MSSSKWIRLVGKNTQGKICHWLVTKPSSIFNAQKSSSFRILESGCPIFRATIPLSRSKLKSKGHWKLSKHFTADQETIETVFRIIVSANQLSLYGAVANMCEECESFHDRSGRPDMVMGQSTVLSDIKTEVLLENDDPAYQNFLL